jgi:FkbM family methyltransferase
MELIVQYVMRKPHEADFLVFKKLRGQGGLFVDIGANVGQSAISFGAINRHMRIVSFEPNPVCEPGLKLAKRILGARYSYNMVGIGPRASKTFLHVPVTGSILATQEASLLKDQLDQDDVNERLGEPFSVRQVPVEIHALDSYRLQPDIIKIDVQGFEIDALQGMVQTLQEHSPLLLIESSWRDGEVTDFLAGLGYRPYTYSQAADLLEPAILPITDKNTINLFFLPEGKYTALTTVPDNSLTGARLLKGLWNSKSLILATTLMGMALAYYMVRTTPPRYTITMAISPSENTDTGGGGLNLSSISSAASLLSGGAGGDKKLNDFTESLRSIDVARTLMNDDRITQHFFGRRGPDGRWQPPAGFMSRVSATYKDLMGQPGWTPPSPYRLSQILGARLAREVTFDSNIQRISYRDSNPAFGIYLLTRATEVADASITLRNQRRLALEQQYVESQLLKTQVTDYRAYLLNLMSQNEKQLMRLASARPYAFTLITPPYASDAPTSPAPTMYMIMGMMGGACFGVALALLRLLFFV